MSLSVAQNGAVVCIGLDLAWSSRNPSGGAVLVDGLLVDWRADLDGNDDVLSFVGKWVAAGNAAVIAVDAPLAVPNQTGARECDKALSMDWRRYKAGVYPASRKLVAYDDGAVRGETLASQFQDAYGFIQRLPVIAEPNARLLCEVYPHAAHVSLFGLEERLRYKAKPGWGIETRHAEFARYQALLRSLADAKPDLRHADELLDSPVAEKRGKQLKALEDALDALTCAYVAAYVWHHGAAGQIVYGSVEGGHIIVPWRLGQSTLSLQDDIDETRST